MYTYVAYTCHIYYVHVSRTPIYQLYVDTWHKYMYKSTPP